MESEAATPPPRSHSETGKRLFGTTDGRILTLGAFGSCPTNSLSDEVLNAVLLRLEEFEAVVTEQHALPCKSELMANFIAQHKARMADAPNR
jgi:hypothetical protein